MLAIHCFFFVFFFFFKLLISSQVYILREVNIVNITNAWHRYMELYNFRKFSSKINLHLKQLLPIKRQHLKMVKHTQTIRWLLPTKHLSVV